MTTAGISAVQLFIKGGPMMVPLFICSVIAVAIVLEKIFYFASLHTDTAKLKKNIFESLKNNQFKEAFELCSANRSPVAQVLKAGILKFGRSREEIKTAMAEAALLEIPPLERKFSALETIVTIAPMLGLLGTILGLTNAFFTLQQQSASLHPAGAGDLAAGIWMALLTTAAGLLIAIPTLLATNFLTSQVNHFIFEIEKSANELATFLGDLSETSSPVTSDE